MKSEVATARPPRVYPPEVIQEPMRRVVLRLRSAGEDLARMRALEFFAREGNWQTISYAAEVAGLDAWEITPAYESALRHNLPNARVRIGDSYELACQPEFTRRFDFIVIDNPQSVFGAQSEHCEHFDALPLVPGLMAAQGIVIFNVNHTPYGYAQQPDWEGRRRAFYGIEMTAHLEFDFLDTFYRRFFRTRGCETRVLFFEPRHEPSLAYCVMKLERRGPSSTPAG